MDTFKLEICLIYIQFCLRIFYFQKVLSFLYS